MYAWLTPALNPGRMEMAFACRSSGRDLTIRLFLRSFVVSILDSSSTPTYYIVVSILFENIPI